MKPLSFSFSVDAFARKEAVSAPPPSNRHDHRWTNDRGWQLSDLGTATDPTENRGPYAWLDGEWCFTLALTDTQFRAYLRRRDRRQSRRRRQEARAAVNTRKTPIPATLRWVVWDRDNFTGRHCGTRRYLSVDHIHPESLGGTLDLSNLQTLCVICNSRKGARI